MLSKLLSLVASAKGAATAGVLATAALGGATVATNDDARQAVREAGDNVAQLVTGAAEKTEAADKDTDDKDTGAGKPAVVAARNDADKKLRSAFHDDHKALEQLHRTHVDKADRQKLEQLINDADKKMRARLTKALDDVATLTLGREGRESPKPSPKPSASPDIHAATVDQAKVDAIVTAAIADMKKILDDTTKAVQALLTSTTGKAGDNNKSENTKSENTKGENTKPENPSNNKPENPGKRP